MAAKKKNRKKGKQYNWKTILLLFAFEINFSKRK